MTPEQMADIQLWRSFGNRHQTRQPLRKSPHRTMAEVMRTEVFIARADAGWKFTPAERSEFGNLIKKARRHNPTERTVEGMPA
jgi:hypothetical protein